jgi:hypothetical protein
VIDKKKNKQTDQMSARKIGQGLRQGLGQIPINTQDWPGSGISGHPQDEPAPGIFAEIIGDNYFDDSAASNSMADDTNPTLLEEDDPEAEYAAYLDGDYDND